MLPLFYYTLREGGGLILGISETMSGFDDLFTPVDSKWKIYRRRENAVALSWLIEFPTQTTVPKPIASAGLDRAVPPFGEEPPGGLCRANQQGTTPNAHAPGPGPST